MTISLGLDIGTNSVGSAWVDTEKKEIHLGVSVFSAGVEESDNKRGAPKNQARRNKRSQRRSIRRRAKRKSQLRQTLTKAGLLPADEDGLRAIFGPKRQGDDFDLEKYNPWHLRREGLNRALTPYEFGRVLVHLNQRRGSLGVDFDDEGGDADAGAVKQAYRNLKSAILARYVCDDEQRQRLAMEEDDYFQNWLNDNDITIGRFLADEYDDRKTSSENSNSELIEFHTPLRNLRDMLLAKDGRAFHANRALILDEFNRLWERQQNIDSPLEKILSKEKGLRIELHSPAQDDTWRVKGDIFGQRHTYWDAGTLGRCDLEPTDHQCPKGDMWAQEFRVLETVNRIKVEWQGKDARPLTLEERAKVISVLSKQKTATYKTVRKALGFDKKEIKGVVTLNLEREKRIDINTNWFSFKVITAFGEKSWNEMSSSMQESVNRAFLRVSSAEHIRTGAKQWWKVNDETAELLVDAWKSRPNPTIRGNLSRKAIKNLLSYMRGEYDGRFMGVTEAKQAFAADADNDANDCQRQRYSLTGRALTAADRRYLAKHTDSLPPAPMLANPVVRKSIHEVRRHVNAYIRKFGVRPDRVVVELARNAKMPEKLRNQQLSANRNREKETKQIIQEFGLEKSSKSQQLRAVLRVKLCIEQRHQCAYCSDAITPRTAATGQTSNGERIEIDHIVPMSRSQNNGFNNKVLCHARCNREKGSQTPKEWLSEEAFHEMEQRLSHLGNAKYKINLDGYACKGNSSKWKNLHRDVHSLEDEEAMDEWRNSQLTDTSYASLQVMAYLRDALYGGETEGERHVFASNGKYTSMLRRDWGLVEDMLDQKWHGWKLADNDDKGRARKSEKDRGDHHHHAIDAVVIALSPNYISQIANLAAKWERYKAGETLRPESEGQTPPWGTKASGEFRRQVLEQIEKLIISHRPQNRRIVGALHKDTPYGKAEEYPGLYTERISIEKLKASQFVEPVPEYRQGKLVRWKIPGKGQGRAIRDPGLREDLMVCLKANGLNPATFTDSELKKLINLTDYEKHELRLPSGVPIYSYIALLALNDPVCIEGGDRVKRYYMGGNNHHMEILEDKKTGKWSSKCWDMYTVARRVRPPNGVRMLPMVIGRKLEQLRSNNELPDELAEIYKGKRFVMSLAIGEIVFLKHKETKQTDYFVVHKLDDKKAYFHPHWDGRRASGKNKRDEIDLSALQIQQLIEDSEMSKVSVDPLGQIRWAND